jgi:hypothetical protein
MSSRTVVATCHVCKEKYFEPRPRKTDGFCCGHCMLVRSNAQDGTPESAAAAAEYRRQQIARNVARRPRVSDVINSLDDE